MSASDILLAVLLMLVKSVVLIVCLLVFIAFAL